ncbi:MAG: phenylacetate--CoA ligase [Mycobacteriales bacterium]
MLVDLTPDPGWLDPIETASLDELRALQLGRLQESLRRAATVPHYQRAFAAAGVSPADCRSLADLRRFPFTTKAHLRENYPFGMFTTTELSRIHASSGTTGQPTVVGYTAADVDMWAEVMARSLRAAGIRPGWRVHVSYGYGLFTGGLGAHYGAERLGCVVVPMSGGQTERQARLIQDFAPDAICVTPSYLLAILDEVERLQLDASSLKVAVLGAEPWTEDMRTEIQTRAGLHAIDIYGLSEVIGPGVAVECVETKDGLHIWEDHFFPEIVDPDTGEPLPDGTSGELVFTSLTKRAMPIVRYRTRDLTRLLPGTARTMRRMEKVTGRSDDMIILRGVNLFPTQVEELLLRVDGLSPHYQLVLSRPARLDELTVRVEARAGSSRSDPAWARAADELRRLIKHNAGVTVSCEVVPPGTIARSEGKAQRVVDNR